jgi:hypothetical protein
MRDYIIYGYGSKYILYNCVKKALKLTNKNFAIDFYFCKNIRIKPKQSADYTLLKLIHFGII